MSFVNLQSIENLADVACNILKIIMTVLLEIDEMYGFAMTSQVDQEYVEMPHEGPDLEKPNRRTASGTVDKHYPGSQSIGGFICLIVKHR